MKNLFIFIEFKISIEKIIRKYINNVNNENIIIINIIKDLLIFIIKNIFGKNPIKGGKPPKDNIFIKMNNLKNLFFIFILNNWFKKFKLNK